jgi:hypothetical protein
MPRSPGDLVRFGENHVQKIAETEHRGETIEFGLLRTRQSANDLPEIATALMTPLRRPVLHYQRGGGVQCLWPALHFYLCRQRLQRVCS